MFPRIKSSLTNFIPVVFIFMIDLTVSVCKRSAGLFEHAMQSLMVAQHNIIVLYIVTSFQCIHSLYIYIISKFTNYIYIYNYILHIVVLYYYYNECDRICLDVYLLYYFFYDFSCIHILYHILCSVSGLRTYGTYIRTTLSSTYHCLLSLS